MSSTLLEVTGTTTHTCAIGVIYPPLDMRNIVDKTSEFVAKNGPEFEKLIIANNTGNSKFSFLFSSNPYHAYYQKRLSGFRSLNQFSAQQPCSQLPELASVVPKPDSPAHCKPHSKVVETPASEQYTVGLPEGITEEELDIIKLTAQFAARNGKSFLAGLTSREINNPQFHFLKPSHKLFIFFTSLADAYSKVLMPPNGLTEKLKESVADMTTVLERCVNRVEWESSLEQERQKDEDEIEQERIQRAKIDWHDFVVVETIDFADAEDEELPTPMSLVEVVRLRKVITGMEEDIELPGEEVVGMEMDEDEMQLIEEGLRRTIRFEENDDKKKNDNEVIEEKSEQPMRIVKNWNRPEDRVLAKSDPTKYVISAITGELIPVNEMSEYTRISLIDPKYREQKEKMFAKIRETTLARDYEISRNIVELARARPDIFGTTEEEVSCAVTGEIEKKRDEQAKQVIWDGHTSASIGCTANEAMSQNINGGNRNGAFSLNNDARNLPGHAAPPPPKPSAFSVRPLPQPPGLALSLPCDPPNMVQYSTSTRRDLPVHPPMIPVVQYQSVRPPRPPMLMNSARQSLLVNQPPPMHPSMCMNASSIPVPPPPVSEFPAMQVPRAYIPLPLPLCPPTVEIIPSLPQAMPSQPAFEESLPLFSEEPEPKRRKLDGSMLVPEDEYLKQHGGPAWIIVSVPSVDDGNLDGQFLEIAVQSLSETIESLKDTISRRIQLPAKKQKLSGKSGFLRDNMSLAYYNIRAGETLALSLRERGGKKR